MLAAASIAIALAAADTYVVVLALTDMMGGVGVGIDSIQKATPIVSGFLLGYIAVLPLIGRLADLVPRHRILLACLVIFTAGSVMTALSVELPVLVAGRFVQGVGGGGLVPATLALVADLWPAHRRGTPLGVVGAVQELGSVVGPLLGAAVLAVWDWRGIFWVNAAAGVLLWFVIRSLTERGPPAGAPGRGRVRLRRSWPTLLAAAGAGLAVLALVAPHAMVSSVAWGAPFVPIDALAGLGSARLATPVGISAVVLLAASFGLVVRRAWPVLRRVDLLGSTFVAVALGALILTFASADPEREVVGPLGLRLLPVGAVAVLLAVAWHRRTVTPLVPRGAVRGRSLAALVCSFFVGAALVAIVVDVPLLARLTLTESMTGAAFVLVRFLLAVPVGALVGGVLLRVLPSGLVAAPGLGVAAFGIHLMSGWDRHSMAAVAPTTIALVLAGAGLGVALAPVNAAALDDAPADYHGGISSLLVVARMVGMVVGLALLTAIGLNRYYAQARLLHNPTTEQLLDAGVVQVQTVFAGGAVSALIAAAAALALGVRRELRDRPRDQPAA